MLDSGIVVLKNLLPYYEIMLNNIIGYGYNTLKNELWLPPSEISEFKAIGISMQKSDRMLRLEYFTIENQLQQNIPTYNHLDSVSQFVLVALVKLTSLNAVISQKEMLDYLIAGRFSAAAQELEKINANSRLITILKTGKVR